MYDQKEVELQLRYAIKESPWMYLYSGYKRKVDRIMNKGSYPGLMITGNFNHSSTSWDDLRFPTASKKCETHFTDFVRISNFVKHVGYPTFLMSAFEAKSTLDLIFTEKSNKIDNLAAEPSLADPRRGHVSLEFDSILDLQS